MEKLKESWKETEELTDRKRCEVDRVDQGWVRFYKMKDKYDITIVDVRNNIVQFFIEDKIFLFALPSKKIREKGKKDWSSKIVNFLKERFDGKIPSKNDNKIVNELKVKENKRIFKTDVINFGKYKGHTYENIFILDREYLEWLLDNTTYDNLREFLSKII